jgi:hypothetical protein
MIDSKSVTLSTAEVAVAVAKIRMKLTASIRERTHQTC